MLSLMIFIPLLGDAFGFVCYSARTGEELAKRVTFIVTLIPPA